MSVHGREQRGHFGFRLHSHFIDNRTLIRLFRYQLGIGVLAVWQACSVLLFACFLWCGSAGAQSKLLRKTAVLQQSAALTIAASPEPFSSVTPKAQDAKRSADPGLDQLELKNLPEPRPALPADPVQLTGELVPTPVRSNELVGRSGNEDRVFMISTRHLPYYACHVPEEEAEFRYYQVNGYRCQKLAEEDYFASLMPNQPIVFYVHGNRMAQKDLLGRATVVRNYIRRYHADFPINWVIVSWPSAKEGLVIQDFREKGWRCDAQGFYLATLMQKHSTQVPMAMVGYSFGARVITGALHALAGGSLAGRKLHYEPLLGREIDVALVAPAVQSNWLATGGYHQLATKNMNSLNLLFNHRDAVLKRYWLLNNNRRTQALGHCGPTCFAPRLDGSSLPVIAKDYARAINIRHAELEYYRKCGNAGYQISKMVNGLNATAETVSVSKQD